MDIANNVVVARNNLSAAIVMFMHVVFLMFLMFMCESMRTTQKLAILDASSEVPPKLLN